jgi:hypothetical protein
MDDHVLQHTLGIALKALSQGFLGIFIGIVGNKGHVGSLDTRGKFTSLGHILADILVVPHRLP